MAAAALAAEPGPGALREEHHLRLDENGWPSASTASLASLREA